MILIILLTKRNLSLSFFEKRFILCARPVVYIKFTVLNLNKLNLLYLHTTCIKYTKENDNNTSWIV